MWRGSTAPAFRLARLLSSQTAPSKTRFFVHLKQTPFLQSSTPPTRSQKCEGGTSDWKLAKSDWGLRQCPCAIEQFHLCFMEMYQSWIYAREPFSILALGQIFKPMNVSPQSFRFQVKVTSLILEKKHKTIWTDWNLIMSILIHSPTVSMTYVTDTSFIACIFFKVLTLTCATVRAFALDCNEGMFSK